MTHELIDRIVRQANPVPDLTVLGSVPASVLQMEGRTEVQTQNRIEMEPEGKPPKRHVWLAIAAMAVILIGALLLLRSEPSCITVTTAKAPKVAKVYAST